MALNAITHSAVEPEVSSVPADLAFNTAASFTTNTNWQNYGGEL
jgi:K+-transporting ATPase A subunit